MATVTPNFGWDVPQSTDLVKDGATAIAALGNDIDTSLVDLKGGTTGQVLSKASNTDMDFVWTSETDPTAIQKTIVDAKGDLISATAADTPARLAVGTDGQVLTADSTQSTGLKWATPATALTWTGRLALTTSFNRVRYANNLYVAVGSSGGLYTSTNGTSWTSRTSGFGANTIFDVHYNATNNIWIAVGENGTITTSSDGITWTARTSNMSTNQIYAVTSSGGTIVAVGEGGGTANTGGITYSTDGITWTRKSQSLTVGTGYNSVIYNGTNWIVGANNSTNNHLYASTPSGTWTAGGTGSAANCVVVAWDGTRNITIEGPSGSFRYSTSLTLGTTTPYNSLTTGSAAGTSTLSKLSYYNGRVYTAFSGTFCDFSTIPTSDTALDQGQKSFIPGGLSGNASANGYSVVSTGRFVQANDVLFSSF